VDDFRQAVDLDQLTSDDTVALARTAAEAVRGLNHATNSPAGLDQPATAYEVAGALALAASRLPQLLAQVSGYLTSALGDGRLGCDHGADPAPAVAGAVASLSGARASASALARNLDAAQQHLAPVHGQPAPGRKNTP
jgi:hypothetical protein